MCVCGGGGSRIHVHDVENYIPFILMLITQSEREPGHWFDLRTFKVILLIPE